MCILRGLRRFVYNQISSLVATACLEEGDWDIAGWTYFL